MMTTTDRPQPGPRPKAQAPSIREVCLVGSPARRYLHTTLIGIGRGLPGRDRVAEDGRRAKPCPTP